MFNADLTHCALLLIEFQNEWLNENGKLHHLFADKGQFTVSLKNAETVIRVARESTIHIIHSGLNYSSGYKELGGAKYGLRAAIPAHQTFLAESNASGFAAPFDPRGGEFVVSGRLGSSAFAGSNLDVYLRNNQINTLYLMGYAMHVCVESTLRAAHDLGYETILIPDASSAFTQAQQNYVVNEIVHHFGATIKSQDLLTILETKR